ncbi:unnamed protein product [Cylicocyclus nassatus]|uniref:ABC transporter domain-containing protein n=1 Tax=Cylicocyclus nassatus TaxID=53992 RepID=A0AA36H9H4_CYLNA|nr:unnamed protein product [Cylicocyclus nassatus]
MKAVQHESKFELKNVRVTTGNEKVKVLIAVLSVFVRTVILLMTVLATASRCSEICKEKSCGLKKLIETTGTGQLSFCLSHVMISFLCICFVLIFLETLNTAYFWHTYIFLFDLTCVLTALAFAIIAHLCSILAPSSLTAGLTSFLVCTIMLLVSFLTPISEKCTWFLALNPASAYRTFFESIIIDRTRGAGIFDLEQCFHDVMSPLESLFYLTSSFIVFAFVQMSYIICVSYSMESTYRSVAQVSSSLSERRYDPDGFETRIDPTVVLRNVSKQWKDKKESSLKALSMKAYCGQRLERCSLSLCNCVPQAYNFSVWYVFPNITYPVIGKGVKSLRCSKVSVNVYSPGRKGLICVGYCPRENALLPKLTVSEYLWLFYGLKCGDGKWKEETEVFADILGLGEYMDEPVENLTPTQKQLLRISLAFIGDSTIVLLEEPFDDLSPESMILLKKLLDRERDNRCVIISTTSACTAEMVADYVVIFHNGEGVVCGNPLSLQKKEPPIIVFIFFPSVIEIDHIHMAPHWQAGN